MLTFEKGLRYKSREVAIPLLVLTEQKQGRWPVDIVMIGKPQVDADNRLDSLLECLLVKLHHAKKVAVIGQRNRRHTQFGALPHQHRDPHGTVDDRVLGVQMQMNEALRHSVPLRSPLINPLSI